MFFFGRAGADPVVLEPDDPNRRALDDVDAAVSIKVDGVHRRRALAINWLSQQSPCQRSVAFPGQFFITSHLNRRKQTRRSRLRDTITGVMRIS